MKRVLRNIGSEAEPYWAFVPKSFAHLQPLEDAPVRPLQTRPKVKAFANPRSFGYGGGETPWPFDRQRAMDDVRYRTGVRNAINANWTASNWKYEARLLLTQVLEDLLLLEEQLAARRRRAREIVERAYKFYGI